MRKFFNIFLFVLCTIAIAGCNDTESSESRLEIKAVNTNFQATGGKGYIQLQATGNITADVNADWCVLKEVNPNEVVFEVKENTGYSGRNALLTISNGVEKKAFNINQSGAVFIFGKDEWMLRTDNKAATLPIKLQSSFDYTIDIPAEAQEWLSFEQNAKGINFKVKENPYRIPKSLCASEAFLIAGTYGFRRIDKQQKRSGYLHVNRKSTC